MKRRRLVAWRSLKKGIVEKVFYSKQGSRLQGSQRDGRNANLLRVVKAINYKKTSGKFPGLRVSDNFAIRWEGFLLISLPGVYTFYLKSDDGSKLYIDKRTVVDNDGLHGMKTKSGRVRLSAGQHYFFATMFEKTGAAGFTCIYKGPDTRNRNHYVRAKLRYVVPKGFKEEVYYINNMKKVPSLNRAAQMERIRPHIVYGCTKKSWPGIGRSDNFAVRWTGAIGIVKAGAYRWSLLSDDGSKLYIAGGGRGFKQIVNNDGLHSIRNKEGALRVHDRDTRYQMRVRVEYFEAGGKACAIFRYMGPDTRSKMVFVPQKVMRAGI